jgi:hypothetical protein
VGVGAGSVILNMSHEQLTHKPERLVQHVHVVVCWVEQALPARKRREVLRQPHLLQDRVGQRLLGRHQDLGGGGRRGGGV